MKVEKIIKTTLELDITESTLLTIKEVKQLPERLRRYANWWWLKSPGHYSNSVAYVQRDSFVNCYGAHVECSGSIRPILIISNLESSNFQIGDIFEFGNKLFEIISDDRAFCLSDIGSCVFRKDGIAHDGNDYKKSDVKKYINNWFEKATEQ